MASLSAELATRALNVALDAAVHAEREARAALASVAAPLHAQSAAAEKACDLAMDDMEHFQSYRLDFIAHDLKHMGGLVRMASFPVLKLKSPAPAGLRWLSAHLSMHLVQ